MANIKVFDTPQLGLRPSETGIETVAGNARRQGAFFHEEAGSLEQLAAQEGQAYRSVGNALGGGVASAGEVAVNYMDHKEISAGAAKGTQLMAGLTDQWNKIASDPNLDPNDTTIKQKFMQETLEPALQQFKDESGFFSTEKSQQFAESFIDRFRQQMDKDTSADMSKLAGIALKTNVQTTVNSLSTMVNSDPSKIDFALDTANHAINAKVDSAPTLDAVTAASVRSEVGLKAKSDIVKSGILGILNKNPDADLSSLVKKYDGYVNASEVTMFQKYAQAQKRSENYDFELQRRREKEVATDKSNAKVDQYLVDVRSQDPKLANDPTAKTILNDHDLLPAAKNNLLNYIDRQLKPETQSQLSQQTFVGLLRDLRTPDSNPDEVMDKAWKARLTDPGKPGSMSEKDFNQFRQEVIARKTPEGAALETDRSQFFKNYGTAIAGATYTPAIGDPKVYNAEMDARRVETDLKRKGLDPHLAYDPASPYFLGDPKRIAKWSSSMQQDLTTMSATPKREDAMPAVPPANQRSPGLYQTPRGNMRWTGTGWVNP